MFGWLKDWLNKQTAPDPAPYFPSEDSQVQVYVVPKPAYAPPAAFAHFGLRRGSWVMTPQGVGIVRNIVTQEAIPTSHVAELTVVDVMLVHEDGTNKVNVLLPPHEVAPATNADIPLSRRPLPAPSPSP